MGLKFKLKVLGKEFEEKPFSKGFSSTTCIKLLYGHPPEGGIFYYLNSVPLGTIIFIPFFFMEISVVPEVL